MMRKPHLATSLPALLLAAALLTASPARAATCPAPGTTTASSGDWLACIEPLAAAALRDIEVLSADDMAGRAPATDGSAKARAYIVGRLQALGVAPFFAGYEQRFTFEDDDGERDGANVVAVVPGTGSDHRLIVLTAHYDHLGVQRGEVYNGADDNASGVAALLAIAAVLQQAAPAHTVVFAFVDAEEVRLDGSRALLRHDGFPRRDVALNINLDMVGHGTNDELFAMGGHANPTIRALIAELPRIAPLTLVERHDDPDDSKLRDWSEESDQRSFDRKAIPWLYFANEEHADYHEPSDDFATIQPAFFTAAVTTALAAVRLADQRLDTIRFPDTNDDDDEDDAD